MAQLISDEYRDQQKTMHESGDYGTAGGIYAPQVEKLIEANNVQTVLDYGAGSNLSLLKAIGQRNKIQHKFRYIPYEPAVDKYAEPPDPAEMVVCLDVLEHIEPDLLGNVLDDLARVTQRIGFFTVSCVPAAKVLPDGRNAHLIQQPPEWWLPIIMQRFTLQTYQRAKNGFFVLVSP